MDTRNPGRASADGQWGRRDLIKGVVAGTSALALAGRVPSPSVAYAATAPPPPPQGFDFNTGKAPIEVIIPTVIPVIARFVSMNAMDASIVLRITTIITNAWFDAIAPYHPTAMGVYSRIRRQPPGQRTTANMNVATLYASLRVLNSLLPGQAAEWRGMLRSVNLNPDDTREDATSPIGIGNHAGRALAEAREQDGMNQLGDFGGRAYNRQPYADTTGYMPVNSAEELGDASRWQPQIVTAGNGIFRVQKFVTPQWAETAPYSYRKPDVFRAPPPVQSRPNHPGYRRQAEQVLEVSATLTDEQKMKAELFDDKLASLGFVALFVSQSRNLSLAQFVHYDFLVNLAAFDTGIATWQNKARFDAVRPFSAIPYLYGDSPVTAWGGPGQGTVSDLPASHWRSYLQTADHPEYPSGSAAFCGAHAEASRRFLGSDALGWAVPAARGSSRIEPGVTPREDIVLGPWATWTQFEDDCGMSRLWGGVHFLPSIPAGRSIGRRIGALAHAFVRSHIEGKVRHLDAPGRSAEGLADLIDLIPDGPAT